MSEGFKILSPGEITKVHIQLGRCQSRQLKATLSTEGYEVQSSLVEEAIRKCGCGNVKERSHVIISNSHISPYPGYAIFVDIAYLQPDTGHLHPYLLVSGTFSRFLICAPSGSIKNKELIRMLEVNWNFS